MKYILKSKRGDNCYNGTREDGWTFIEVDRSMDISPDYIFSSEEEIHNLENYDKLRYWYKIVPYETRLKPKCPYVCFKGAETILMTATGGELCSFCATNILSGEPYIFWKDKQPYCLHCVMSQLSEVDELLGSISAELKEEWKANGKEESDGCMERI